VRDDGTDRPTSFHRTLEFVKYLDFKSICVKTLIILNNGQMGIGGGYQGLGGANLQPSMDVIRNAKLHSDVLSNRMCQFMRSISLCMRFSEPTTCIFIVLLPFCGE